MDVAYKYEELPAERCIRLMRLLPGVSNEQIRLELFTAELDTAPAYEAISYCWGDPNDQQDVICCGKTMQITRSLYTGLQCFRHHDETRILWADAICINQSSDDEKGIQVSMMGDVYDLAARVLVWLGEASEEVAKKAFDLIRRLNDYIESQIVESELVINPLEAFLNVPRLQNLNQIFQSQSHMQALDNLFRRPWFYRLWVLQEVALATSVQVFYGAMSICLSEIVQAGYILSLRLEIQGIFQAASLVDAFYFIFSTYPKENNWIQEKALLRRLRDLTRQKLNISFIQILIVGRRFLATNPLDHIYAFLGHPAAKSRNRGLGTLKADYSLSIEEASQQLVKWLYEEEHRIEFLCNIAYPVASELEHLTSWLPILHRGQFHSSLDHHSWKADSSSSMTKQLVKAIFQDHMLHGVGVVFDSITACSEVSWQQTPQPQRNVVELCWKLQAGCTQITDIEERLMQFYWTLVGGIYTKGAAHLQRDFESYCRNKVSPQVCATMGLQEARTDSTASDGGDWAAFEFDVYQRMLERKFFVTKNGRYGLGPGALQVGDSCCVLLGCRMPLVLRPTATELHFKVVGASYICGTMDGGIMKDINSASDLTEITLV
ncbi:HET domain containing protein [Hyaloscypha variabilis]